MLSWMTEDLLVAFLEHIFLIHAALYCPATEEVVDIVDIEAGSYVVLVYAEFISFSKARILKAVFLYKSLSYHIRHQHLLGSEN